MGKKENKIKKAAKKVIGKSLYTIADIFSTLPCGGRNYEPKVPEKLKK